MVAGLAEEEGSAAGDSAGAEAKEGVGWGAADSEVEGDLAVGDWGVEGWVEVGWEGVEGWGAEGAAAGD